MERVEERTWKTLLRHLKRQQLRQEEREQNATPGPGEECSPDFEVKD